MISYLKGKVIAQGPDYIITETQGVGYKVYISENRFSSYPIGQEVELYCHLHLKREETMELYGVESFQALEVFETLNRISGIGPKAALKISSLGTMAELKDAIKKEDASYFAKVHGIGTKKIQRIILELTGKFSSLAKGEEKKEDTDAMDALVALGFSKQKARAALSQVPKDISSLEQQIKQALRHIR